MAAIFDVPLMRTQQNRNSCSAQIFLENKMDRVQEITSLAEILKIGTDRAKRRLEDLNPEP